MFTRSRSMPLLADQLFPSSDEEVVAKVVKKNNSNSKHSSSANRHGKAVISKTLLVALSCAYASSLTPLSAAGDDNECALYLTGPGRTSAFDYNLNLLKGNFGYEGQHTCITYDAVNQAYLDARNRILVSQPKGDWKPEDYASVGELILDISINLARTYGLTYEEIEKGLPLIDTSRTLIREVCPPVFSHVECRAGKYRRLDGLCNNLRNPTWGATNSPFQRLIGPLFADGINAPRISHTGRDLPLSRVVSRTMHPDDGFHDHAGTVMVIAWGQFMDHDFTLTGTPLDPINRNDPEECCKRPLHLKHPYCNEIRVPDDDYFYRLFGVKCIDFVRAFPSPRPGCRLGSRVPFNTLTGAIDGNTVYGVTDKFSRKLRTGYGGLLRMNPVFKEYGLKELLPLKLDIPDEGCTRPNKNMYCFEAGEIRVNEQLVLTVMHTLMAREHNRVAEALAAVNPHWDDETLFQEARRINIAEIQHITYNEFLPILLGKDVMEKFGLVLEKQGFWEGYDENVNPDVIDSFAAAAYRFGHSLLPTAVERWSKAHKFIASKRLSDLIRRPYDLYRAGVLDEYVMGLMNQVAQAMDDSITQEVTNHLFKKVGARFGMDLVSFNMQRGREFGLPGYMEFRKFCGLSGADSFQDLFGSMPNQTVQKYETIFEHPIDVDLWSGGVSERPLPGSMLGPTFACVIATQFSYSRRGDRFWFELPNQPSSFTPEQLAEIKKSRLARIICDNTDIIDTVQLYPFVLPDHELNPRVPCRSGILPAMDFSKWAEPAPFAGAAKQFITEAKLPEPGNFTDEITNKTNIPNTYLNSDCQNSTNTNGSIRYCGFNGTTHNNIESEKLMLNNCTDTNNCKPTTVMKVENNNDILLNYINRNNVKDDFTRKNKSHPKNSLSRRKRSSVDPKLIVNYETSHSPVYGNIAPIHEDPNNPSAPLDGDYIQNSNLANFNIKTVHDEVPEKDGYEKTTHLKNHYYPEKTRNFERDEDRKVTNIENADDSQENKNGENPDTKRYNHENQSKEDDRQDERDNSNESGDNNDSIERSNYSAPEKQNSEESYPRKELGTRNDFKLQINSREKNNEDSSEQSRSKSDETESSEHSTNGNAKFTQNSNENDEEGEESDERTSQNKPGAHSRQNSPLAIQDVDIGYFDYENIHPENKNTFVNLGTNNPTAVDILHPGLIPVKNSVEENDSLEKSNENYEQKPVRINDDEVKPVVEINPENYSEQSEESPHDTVKHKPNYDNLNLGENESSEQSEKVVSKIEKIDPNQQFERIPLDYKHDNEKNKDNSHGPHPTESPDEVSNEDTEKAPPENSKKYDEHLNSRFNDVTVKLPDIILPEDILAIPYDAPSEEEEKDKEIPNDDIRHHDNSNEDNSDNNKPNGNDDDDHHFYDHYPNDEKDNKKDDNDDDLYEKFVRERFGKRGTFQERSAGLQEARVKPLNVDLARQVHNVLKKTRKIHDDAKRSGDPNAGFMWTLEYGQNL